MSRCRHLQGTSELSFLPTPVFSLSWLLNFVLLLCIMCVQSSLPWKINKSWRDPAPPTRKWTFLILSFRILLQFSNIVLQCNAISHDWSSINRSEVHSLPHEIFSTTRFRMLLVPLCNIMCIFFSFFAYGVSCMGAFKVGRWSCNQPCVLTDKLTFVKWADRHIHLWLAVF